MCGTISTTAGTNNHLPLRAYDSSGNATSDGFVTNYQWDGESQLKSAAGVNYLYDGDGRRVAKTGSKLYWYGSGGDILAETDAAGNTLNEYIFFGGKRIAMLPAGGNPTYYVEDMLGTSRVLTTNAGVVCYNADFYPYGGERSYTNTCPQNYKFEGKERDSETGNDDFGARYYSNRFGRWLSADWSAVPEAVPYANLSNPQTLNLYAMVSDDPESFADLDGHCCEGLERTATNFAHAMERAAESTAGGLEKGAKAIENSAKDIANTAGTSLGEVVAGAASGDSDKFNEGMGTLAFAVLTLMSDSPEATVEESTVEGAAEGAVGSGESAIPESTEPYNRRAHYGNTPTAADRKAVGGESVDHDPPLVERYYKGDPARGEKPGRLQTPQERRASANDRSRMKPSTLEAQHKQGGKMSQYSKQMKKKLKIPAVRASNGSTQHTGGPN